MSEAANETVATAEIPEPLFSNADLREFESEDVAAGQIICKMLSILFIYTLVAMSIVSIWTATR